MIGACRFVCLGVDSVEISKSLELGVDEGYRRIVVRRGEMMRWLRR